MSTPNHTKLYHQLLEPIVNYASTEDAVALTSIAVSMKRIADTLEQIEMNTRKNNND